MVELAQATGNVIGGVAGYEAGKYNAKVAETEAVQSARDGAGQESRVREAARMAIGQQVAAQGANGFQQGTGSAVDAIAQSQVNAMLDALTIRREAAARSRSLRVSGAIAKAQGANALVQGMVGASAKVVDWSTSKKAG